MYLSGLDGIITPMKTSPSALPDDTNALREIIAQQAAQLSAKDAQLSQKTAVIEDLYQQLNALKRHRFGRSSEQVEKNIHQTELQLEELETQIAQTTASDDEASSMGKRPPKRRVKLPESLPRDEKRLDSHQSCPCCDGKLTHIGDDVSEMLDVVPVSYRVIKIVRPKYSCSQCETLVQDAAPERVIKKGLPSANVLTQVMVDKYLDHQPLYRQAQKMAREGIDVERSTLADWVGQVSRLLTPLADAVGKHVKQASHLHADDTTAPTLSPGKGRTQVGRYWTYVRDGRAWNEQAPPAVWLQYSEDRKSIHPTSHLRHFKGALQADAYAGYNDVYRNNVTFVACMAHVRRKFYEVAQSGPAPIAEQVIAYIQQLYAIEKDIRNQPPDKRYQVRKQQAIPILDSLYEYLDNRLRTVSKGSAISKAIAYAIKQKDGIYAYTKDGRAAIDNNSAERYIRPIALGRKNYLFAGSKAGGERAALLYSILGTAKLNDINPTQYLTAVLKRISQHPINQIDKLLPWNIDLNDKSSLQAI